MSGKVGNMSDRNLSPFFLRDLLAGYCPSSIIQGQRYAVQTLEDPVFYNSLVSKAQEEIDEHEQQRQRQQLHTG